MRDIFCHEGERERENEDDVVWFWLMEQGDSENFLAPKTDRKSSEHTKAVI